MKAFKTSALALLFCLLFGFSLVQAPGQGRAQDQAGVKTRVESAPTSPEKGDSFIRMDLLSLASPERDFPKRNIFAPRSSSGAFSSSLASSVSDVPDKNLGGLTGQEKETPVDQTTGPGFSFSLRYIGYIESARRTIGLIFLDGQAQAVAEGEVIREGIRVGRITPAEIEILFPDATTKTFSLEGE